MDSHGLNWYKQLQTAILLDLFVFKQAHTVFQKPQNIGVI